MWPESDCSSQRVLSNTHRYMRELEPTVMFSEVLRHLVISYSANDPIVGAALKIQR